MAKFESIIKSEIVRLAKREVRKIAVPLKREFRLMRGTLSQLRKAVLSLQRITSAQQKEIEKRRVPLEAEPEEVKAARFSPRLIRSLRRRLRITQKELALLTGVTVGAVHQWESGQFKPAPQKRAIMVGLRRLGRREVRKLLEEKKPQRGEKEASSRKRKPLKKARRR